MLHVIRDNRQAKFWLDPVKFERSKLFSNAELNRIKQLIMANQERSPKNGMNSSYYELVKTKLSGARAMDVSVTDDALSVSLEGARIISVPLVWYPRLWHGTPVERSNWEIIESGCGIHWPDLDEDISVKALLIGNPSGESRKSLKWWLEWREAQVKDRGSSRAVAKITSTMSDMSFWDSIYELCNQDIIPNEWKRKHLREYLENPKGRFAHSSITTIPSNQSMNKDGSEIGDYIKKGQTPKAWRVSPKGTFRLIMDPSDDEVTQAVQLQSAKDTLKRLGIGIR